MAPSFIPAGTARQRGFTLVEIVVVILVVAILIAMAAALTRGVAAAQKRSLTATRIQTVDAALVQFVQQQKRLPCPALGNLASGDVNAGTEGARDASGCTGLQHGVVPWRALGLSESDATDAWDRRLTYRPHPALGLANAMDMAWCDPAGTGALVGTACNPACTASSPASCTPPTTFLASKGLRVRNVAGTLIMDPTATPHTGAAYVVISHGESGGGGYLGSGTLATSTAGDGTEELKNYATTTWVAASTYYVDDTLNETATAAHFDDIVSRPTVLGVISKAALGPRSH